MPFLHTQTPFTKLFFCFLLFFTASSFITKPDLSTVEPKALTSIKKAGDYYVLAPSGLKLRSQANVRSNSIITIPYGAKVELLQEAQSADMLVDNFPGGMAKVSYDGQVGYTFDGYLCRMPIRKSEYRNIKKYMEWARGKGASVLYEKCERDYDGYYQEEETIMPYINDWAEAFLLAKNLFDLPFDYPAQSKKQEESFVNPNKPEMIWEDSLTITRNEKGEVQRMIRYYRGEGGGTTIVIEPDGNQNSLRISRVLISD